MNRSIFFIAIFTIFSLQVRADDYPFYFFALRIMNLPNVQETAKAEKELCSFITKNCELSKEKGLKFSIMKLHDGPDEKSKVVGAFVNALKDGCYGNDEEIDHCNASGKASFVVLIDGTRLSLDHYLSVDESKFEHLLFYARRGVGYGEEPHNYLRYVRVMDAIPKKETSFYRPSPHWYALASPKKDNSKIWFNYSSDLRSVFLTEIALGHKTGNLVANTCSIAFDLIDDDLVKRLKEHYSSDFYISKNDPCYATRYFICGSNQGKLKIKVLSSKDYKTTLQPVVENFLKISHKVVLSSFSQKPIERSVCDTISSTASFLLPVSTFYENGFLKEAAWFRFIEMKKKYELKIFLEKKLTNSK